MNEFKIGDIVQYYDTSITRGAHWVSLNNIYKVVGIRSSIIQLVATETGKKHYAEIRFIELKDKKIYSHMPNWF